MMTFETVKYVRIQRLDMSDRIVTLKVKVGRKTDRKNGKEYPYYIIRIPMRKIRILSDKAKIAIYPAEWIDKSD